MTEKLGSPDILRRQGAGGRQLLVAQGLGLAGLMIDTGEVWPWCPLLSPFNSLLLGDTAPPSPNPVSPLNYFLPGLFDFKGELGSWKSMKTKGLTFFLSCMPPLSTLALHAVVTPTCLLHPECPLPSLGFLHTLLPLPGVPFLWSVCIPANFCSFFKTQLRFYLGSTHHLPSLFWYLSSPHASAPIVFLILVL